MFKYNLAVFIKLLSLLVLLTPLLFSQENNNDSTLKTSQIYERIMFIEVRGSQRIESDTIKSYMTVKPGDLYDDAEVDRSLKILFNTGLFADVAIRYEKSGLIVFVIENPIINRIDFEGNKALKDDKFEEEIELSPRSVYTRSKVQADVQRLVELYRRSGRFSAYIEPKVIRQPQNRIDLIFEISEGPTTGVSSINFLGNRNFRDRKLKSQLVTKESKWWKFFSSDDSYDPDKLAYDREQIRKFYLDEGYADFQVVSAVAELTKDGKNFVITFVLDEGQIYEFGNSSIESTLENMNTEELLYLIEHDEGNQYKATDIDNTVDAITLAVGEEGYASAEVRPRVRRKREEGIVDIVYFIEEGPRVYIEKININENTRTRDEVIRRELRVSEGDSYNKVLIDRSETKIKSLGYFREVETSIRPGSEEDRMIVEFEVEEQPTGELTLGAGFSSAESLLLEIGISERNLLGRGQSVRLNVSTSERRKQFEIGFTQPYFLGRKLTAGFDIFHIDNDYRRYSSYRSTQSGASIRAVWPMAEYASLSVFYRFLKEEIDSYFFQSGYNLADDYNADKSEIGYSYCKKNYPEGNWIHKDFTKWSNLEKYDYSFERNAVHHMPSPIEQYEKILKSTKVSFITCFRSCLAGETIADLNISNFKTDTGIYYSSIINLFELIKLAIPLGFKNIKIVFGGAHEKISTNSNDAHFLSEKVNPDKIFLSRCRVLMIKSDSKSKPKIKFVVRPDTLLKNFEACLLIKKTLKEIKINF